MIRRFVETSSSLRGAGPGAPFRVRADLRNRTSQGELVDEGSAYGDGIDSCEKARQKNFGADCRPITLPCSVAVLRFTGFQRGQRQIRMALGFDTALM